MLRAPGGASQWCGCGFCSEWPSLSVAQCYILNIQLCHTPLFFQTDKCFLGVKMEPYRFLNELTPRKSFVIIQATPHRPFWVGSWSFCKKYNNVPSLHMYRFIIKAARPAIFIRFAHIYVLVPNMYNLGLRYFAHNQGLKALPRVIF